MSDQELLRLAIELAVESATSGGGPFGALVVRGGSIVAQGANRVVEDGDPTAHAEVVAIREAARELGTHDLSGCVLYASCEPCPMCLAAAHWARIDRLVYGAGRGDAAAAGFDDERLYHELALDADARELTCTQELAEQALEPFRAWEANPDKRPY